MRSASGLESNRQQTITKDRNSKLSNSLLQKSPKMSDDGTHATVVFFPVTVVAHRANRTMSACQAKLFEVLLVDAATHAAFRNVP